MAKRTLITSGAMYTMVPTSSLNSPISREKGGQSNGKEILCKETCRQTLTWSRKQSEEGESRRKREEEYTHTLIYTNIHKHTCALMQQRI